MILDMSATGGGSPRALQTLLTSADPQMLFPRRPPGPGGMSVDRIVRVMVFIESDLENRIRTDSLARVVCLSKSHFIRSFKIATGMTPSRYISCRRIAAAQRMMRSGGALSTIALACGMADQSHFSRVFRRIVGVPPRRWLAAQR